MAKDIRGLYSNNRRRESNSVTCSLPYVLAEADTREGTAQEVVVADDYTTLTLPDGIVVTDVKVIVETGAEYTGANTVNVSIGGSALFAIAVDSTTAGLSTANQNLPLLVENSADVVLTAGGTPAGGDNSVIKVMLTYVDYSRATMSYIGEE